MRDRFRRVFPGLFVLGKAISLTYSSRSFLVQSGFFESVRRKKPCRRDGTPIPWMNYAMIEFLENRLVRNMTVFEYGSGNSTLYFSDRVASVTSVECDAGWYDYIKDGMPDNVTLINVDANDGYVESINKLEQRFDLILVDAEHRNDCLRHAPAFLTERGVILLDDAQRAEYDEGIAAVLAAGFREMPFNGLKAGGVKRYRTTVFYRDGNVFGI
ncbi:MAG: class I SAM-dependent methyltransferase [Pseudomonadota bacterium]